MELIPVSWQSARRDLVINPVVVCHYFPPGLQLLSQPKRSPPLISWWCMYAVKIVDDYESLACKGNTVCLNYLI